MIPAVIFYVAEITKRYTGRGIEIDNKNFFICSLPICFISVDSLNPVYYNIFYFFMQYIRLKKTEISIFCEKAKKNKLFLKSLLTFKNHCAIITTFAGVAESADAHV